MHATPCDPSSFYALTRLLDLRRPLVVIDLESTGVDVQNDRIIEIGLVSLHPDGAAVSFSSLVNPGVPLPDAVTEITGITEEMLAGAPPLSTVAPMVNDYLTNADLAGYNLLKFDLPLLENEFTRLNMALAGPADRKVLDAFQIFRRREPHSLERAVAHYTGRPIQQTHRAIDDVAATAGVLAAQLARYGLIGNLEAVDLALRDPYLDSEGKFKKDGEEVVFCFGKFTGRTVSEVQATEPGYIQWVIDKIGGEAADVLNRYIQTETEQATP